MEISGPRQYFCPDHNEFDHEGWVDARIMRNGSE